VGAAGAKEGKAMGARRSSKNPSRCHRDGNRACDCGRRRRRLCHFCLNESGVALPVSLAVIMVVSGLATVAARLYRGEQPDRP
jgi:hypothetical protein